MTGTTWQVVDFVRETDGDPRGDGDTVRMWRTCIAQLGDDWFRLTDPETEHLGVSIRLPWVDTPETWENGYHQATDDLDAFLTRHPADQYTVICYKSAGWDRLLGDVIDPTGESASQWLMRERGWPMYKPR